MHVNVPSLSPFSTFLPKTLKTTSFSSSVSKVEFSLEHLDKYFITLTINGHKQDEQVVLWKKENKGLLCNKAFPIWVKAVKHCASTPNISITINTFNMYTTKIYT